MPRKTVTQTDIQKMNELYLQIGTYAGVAREVGLSASTVKRYIITDYVAAEEVEKIKIIFDKEIPAAEAVSFPSDWTNFLALSSEEKADCEVLRKEVLI